MKAEEAVSRVNAASDELLHVCDEIKHGSGVQAEFPWPRDWNAYPVIDQLEIAHRAVAEAARLLAKAVFPAGSGGQETT